MNFRRQIKRVLVTTIVLIGVLGVGGGGFYEYLHLSGNIGVVETGVCYRSGQLTARQLNGVVMTDGIRSILNLRGASPGTEWYDDEVATADSRHVVHYDYGISATRFVTPAQSAEILQILHDAPKPILIHCQAGADRTGLVSALYLLAHGMPTEDAKRELSLSVVTLVKKAGNTALCVRKIHERRACP